MGDRRALIFGQAKMSVSFERQKLSKLFFAELAVFFVSAKIFLAPLELDRPLI